MPIPSFTAKATLLAGFIICVPDARADCAGDITDCAKVITDCDLGGKTLESISFNDVAPCREKCLANAGCDGFTFVTGWNKCFLKSGKLARRKIRMGSGVTSRDQNKFDQQWDHDDLGKDMQKLSTSSLEACGQACLANDQCKAFAYIDGYATCWLKSTLGKTVKKQFLCGIK